MTYSILTNKNRKTQKHKLLTLASGLRQAKIDLLKAWDIVSLDAAPRCTWARAQNNGQGLQCVKYCIFKSGYGGTPTVYNARTNRQETIEQKSDQAMAMVDLDLTVAFAIAKATGKKLAFRTDTFSSNWIWSRKHWAPLVAKWQAKGVQFYDYFKGPTKIWQAAIKNGVDITVSYHENMTDQEVHEAMQITRVAVVFEIPKGGSLPKTWKGYKVIDGDLHDARFTEPKGIVVGLKVKSTTQGKPKNIDDRSFVQIGAAA